MRSHARSRFLLLVFLLIPLLLLACRRDPDDEVTPTAPAVTETPASADTTATETPPAPTNTPVPVATVDVADITWPPQVIYSSPAPGEEVTLSGAITIRFDQPMDQASVESAFAVTDNESSAPVAGNFEWPRGDTLVFTPAQQLKRQGMYRVQVSDSAQGLNGQALREAVSLQVETVGFLEVSQVVPAPDTQSVDVDGAITVVFNRPVVPLVASGDMEGLPQPLTIEPALRGSGEWISTSIYRFEPDAPLLGATTYDVQVDAGLEDVVGSVLAQPFNWTFTTTDPTVVEVRPENEAENVLPEDPLVLTFNMPMDQDSVEAALSVGPDAGLDFEWSDDSRVLTATATSGWSLGQEYQVGLGDSAQSGNGQATLDRALTSVFSVVPLPRVVEVHPSANQEAERWRSEVFIRFASPMDIDTLENQVIIDPAPENANYFFSHDRFSVSINFVLERNTEYQVTVPASAADPYGNTLGEPYTWTFTTPPYEPLVSLNLPQYTGISQLSDSHPTDLQVIHRNVSRIDASLYGLGLPMNLIVEPYRVQQQEYSPTQGPIRTWSIETDTAQDAVGVETLSLANGDTLATGVYLVQVDAPEIGQDQRFWQVQSQMILVADTNLVVKQNFENVYVWATDLASGQPSGALDVTLYNESGIEVSSATTDSDGLARFDYRPNQGYLDQVTVVSSASGQAGFGIASTQWDFGVNPFQFNVETNWSPEPELQAYLYTDRPIYRPGDTVYFRGVLRQPNYGRYQLPARAEVTVGMSYLYEFDEGQFSATLPVDDLGNVEGSFTIPEEAQLGPYRLFMQNEYAGPEHMITVAEYRRPEFLVEASAEQPQLLRGEANSATIDATYFFGGSAADLEVNWTVYQKPYQPTPPDGPFFSFSSDTDYYYYRIDPIGGSFFGDFVINGTGRTDSDGQLVIDLPPDLLEDVEEGSREITVEANVLDAANQPVAARTSIIYHNALIYVGVAPEEYVSTAGLETTVRLTTVDWDGEPAPNQPIEVVFYRREWIQERVTEFGQPMTNWVPDDTEVARFAGETNENGEATASFVPEAGGSYLAEATVTDSQGNTHTSNTYLWVSDPNYTGWRLDPREKRMDLTPDMSEYDIGDVATILVQSPFEGPLQAWLTIERGDIIEQRVITIQGGSHLLELPILESYAPNIHVTLAAVKGIDETNEYADMRLGIAELNVSTERLALDVELTARADILQPGETVVYDIQVTDYAGNPVAADLSLSLVDLAVLTLIEDSAPPILEAFYSPQPYRSRFGSGMFVSGEGIEVEIPNQAFGLGGGGGGDAVADGSVALETAEEERTDEEGDEEIRQDFRDTAFWEATVSTDSNGQATVEIPLPDNLTTWRLSSKAASGDTLVGEGQVDVRVTKPVLLRPVTPRFFTAGDQLQIGATVHNNTGQSLSIDVSLEASGVTLDGPAEQTVSVAAGGSQLVQWPVLIEDFEFADLTFRADGGEFSDATKPTFGIAPDQLIPIYRYNAEDIVGTAGVIEDGTRVEAILLPDGVDTRNGSVDISLNASLAGSILDSLEATDYDIDPVCAHAAAYQLMPNVAVARAIRQLSLDEPALSAELDALIERRLADLEQMQKSDGGWGWCFAPQSDPYLSATVLLALAKAQEAGYGVGSQTINRGNNYLTNQLKNSRQLAESHEVNRQAYFLYVLAEVGEPVGPELETLLDEKQELLDPYARGLMALALHIAGGSQDAINTLLSTLNDSVAISATGAHWEDETRDWNNLSSDIRGTAMILSALSQIDPDNPQAPNAVRWLMSARTAGHWHTFQEDAWVLMSLTDWMFASDELNADYSYAVGLNGDIVLEGDYSGSNVTSTVNTEAPVASLNLEDVNFLAFGKDDGTGRLYYTAHLDSYIDADQVGPASRGFTVQRAYYDAACDPEENQCELLTSIEAGQQVRVELTIIAPEDRVFAIVEDHLPSGAQAIDPGLSTSAQGGNRPGISQADRGYQRGYWGWWYFNRIEFRDERVVFYSDFLPAGTYQYSYLLQTNLPGRYQVMPAMAREEFFPEVFGRSQGMVFEITE